MYKALNLIYVKLFFIYLYNVKRECTQLLSVKYFPDDNKIMLSKYLYIVQNRKRCWRREREFFNKERIGGIKINNYNGSDEEIVEYVLKFLNTKTTWKILIYNTHFEYEI